MQELIGDVRKILPPGDRAEKNPEAVRRGKKDGKKGGAARSANLTTEQRAEVGQIASTIRCKRPRSNDSP